MADYPFVERLHIATQNISNIPKLIFGEIYPCRLDSIRCTNTTNNDISVSAYILEEIENAPQEPFISFQEFIAPFKSLDLLEGDRGRILNMIGNGDTLFAYCDSAIKKFDCVVSYTRFLPITT